MICGFMTSPVESPALAKTSIRLRRDALPFQVPSLFARLAYARGTDIVNPSTGSSRPAEWEVDLDLTWNVPAVKGLQVRFRNAYWDNGGPQTEYQFRVILNYEFDLL